MKNYINSLLLFLIWALMLSASTRNTNLYEKAFISNGKTAIGNICYKIIEKKGMKTKLYYFGSLIKGNNLTPINNDRYSFYKLDNNNYYLLLIDVHYGHLVFLWLIDKNLNYIGNFENFKEIRHWTKAYTRIDDDDAWIVKYNLGYSFKDLTIKGDKIYLTTQDGGSGATGGFNIEHVFTVKNGKPVTLVSKFIENTEKEKAIKQFKQNQK